MANPTICVIGAGHGGSAMAAHLALLGFSVRLFNRSEARLRPIQALGGIEL
ncbi:MAG: NAD(P)-binding domain-containing protein, partial [Armatimonadota bacterium]|nr:NAD(P)-binding domain-containing protein [Armatimonadota bacterium]